MPEVVDKSVSQTGLAKGPDGVFTSVVSVIIPAYNGLAYIEETLNSIRAQTYPNVEIVVVDDGSTDGTVDFLKQQPDVTLLQQSNQGPGAARNTAAQAANGDWLAFADCDDLWEPTKLETQLAAVQESGAELAYTNVRPIGDTQGLSSLQHDPDRMPSGNIFPEVLKDNFITLSSVLISRQAFSELGGFTSSKSMRGCEDWNLWLRYLDGGREVTAVPEPLVQYRWRSDSMTADHAGMHNSRLATLESALASDRAQQLPAAERSEARATLYYCSAWFAGRSGSLKAIPLYVRGMLAGGSILQGVKGIARTIQTRCLNR